MTRIQERGELKARDLERRKAGFVDPRAFEGLNDRYLRGYKEGKSRVERNLMLDKVDLNSKEAIDEMRQVGYRSSKVESETLAGLRSKSKRDDYNWKAERSRQKARDYEMQRGSTSAPKSSPTPTSPKPSSNPISQPVTTTTSTKATLPAVIEKPSKTSNEAQTSRLQRVGNWIKNNPGKTAAGIAIGAAAIGAGVGVKRKIKKSKDKKKKEE